MGIYTEIIFGAGLKEGLPEQVVSVIKNLIARKELGEHAPNHAFFKSKRFWLLTSGGSYYFPGIVEPKFWLDKNANQWFLHFRTHIKNDDSEIEKFLDWIAPYIADGVGERNFYAIVTCEESEEPTIYYLGETT